ncbi:hypothetical protein [Desertivirga xinjiangensis]|uniref:hypothetical protein n=1 Tax=Desertivirga xinjiangensis TaxID=539206 RepID=UPI00210D7D26|nr:hypothetical protein [Pedobacter xinjiangensis]
MENQSEYRQQLIKMFHLLDYAAHEFYDLGFTIGLEEEWQDWKATLVDGDQLPVDLEILKALNHPAIPGVIRIIEILADARNSIANLNNLSDEELSISEDPDFDTESREQDLERNPYSRSYIEFFMSELHSDLLSIYEALWELAFSEELPDKSYDYFMMRYYEGGLELASDDQNVKVVLEALNEVLLINGQTEYER